MTDGKRKGVIVGCVAFVALVAIIGTVWYGTSVGKEDNKKFFDECVKVNKEIDAHKDSNVDVLKKVIANGLIGMGLKDGNSKEEKEYNIFSISSSNDATKKDLVEKLSKAVSKDGKDASKALLSGLKKASDYGNSFNISLSKLEKVAKNIGGGSIAMMGIGSLGSLSPFKSLHKHVVSGLKNTDDKKEAGVFVVLEGRKASVFQVEEKDSGDKVSESTVEFSDSKDEISAKQALRYLFYQSLAKDVPSGPAPAAN
jgi:hypothetical protein